MNKELFMALTEDINRIIPIIAKRNNCMDDDVVAIMDNVVSDYKDNN